MDNIELLLKFGCDIDLTFKELHYLKHSLNISQKRISYENEKLEVDETHFIISEDPQY
jgi:hypothetical protein